MGEVQGAALPCEMPLDPGDPLLSVIVPVHNGAPELAACLAALVESRYPREAWELIVVDDASTDDSALTAAEHADVVLRLPGEPRGPAYARNRGCEISRGHILVFVDADVCVHPHVLARYAELFAGAPGLSAAFGSYDASPTAPDRVSQFRNLLHHFVHQSNPGEAETFWSGCGAVTRAALIDVDMFDEWHYSRPQIEDIDLGRRLRSRGHRIELRPEIQCTYLRRWSLAAMVRADFGNRGVPWMRILLQERILAAFNVLNVTGKERLCVTIALLAPLLAVSALVTGSLLPVWGLLGVLGILFAVNASFYRFLWHARGPGFLATALPLHVAYYLTAGTAAIVGVLAHWLVGEPIAPPGVQAQAALKIEMWPPCPRRPVGHLWRRYS